MKKWRKVMIGVLLLALPLYCGLSYWITASATGEDYYYLYYRPARSEDSLALAFTVALRSNNPRAYDFTIPALHAKLDEWMKTHEPRYCLWTEPFTLGSHDTGGRYTVVYSCPVTDPTIREYTMVIDFIKMENGKITNWGNAIEAIKRN